MILKYKDAQKLIKNGDVILVRGASIASWLIKQFGGGLHSHVGVAWTGNEIYSVEFREFKGGVITPLKYFVQKNVVDIFRPTPEFISLYLDDQYNVIETKYKFDGQKVVDYMKSMAGLPYGWRRILLMAFKRFIFLRLLFKHQVDDKLMNGDIYPVCSTAVASAFRNTYVDLTKFKPDFDMEPPDIARSPVLNYLFSIEKDNNV